MPLLGPEPPPPPPPPLLPALPLPLGEPPDPPPLPAPLLPPAPPETFALSPDELPGLLPADPFVFEPALTLAPEVVVPEVTAPDVDALVPPDPALCERNGPCTPPPEVDAPPPPPADKIVVPFARTTVVADPALALPLYAAPDEF